MRAWMLVLTGVISIAAGAACGCSGEVTSGGTGNSGGSGGEAATGGGGGMSTSTGGGGTSTTSSSTPTITGTGPGATLAIRMLRIGDLTPEGNPSSTAWKQYGFNLDGKVSDSSSNDLCKPAEGAKASDVYPDGDLGIDNSFGKRVLPIFLPIAMDLSTQVNDAIDQGQFSVLFRIEGIGTGLTGTFPARAYTGGFAPGAVPAWDGTDVWPVRSDSLIGGDVANPITQFPMSQVAVTSAGARLWRSITKADLRLELAFVFGDAVLPLPLHHAQVSMFLSDDNTQATGGMIGGILDTEELIAELAAVFGAFDSSLCPPSSTFESIAQQIRQASDILTDGTQNPSATCNGISLGFGFEAEAADLGAVFDQPAAPDPCAP